MALAGPPEIARPPSQMVVACTCNENRACGGENWPCECISVRSLHQIVTNHPAGLSLPSVCFSPMLLDTWTRCPRTPCPLRSDFVPDLALLPDSRARVSSLMEVARESGSRVRNYCSRCWGYGICSELERFSGEFSGGTLVISFDLRVREGLGVPCG